MNSKVIYGNFQEKGVKRIIDQLIAIRKKKGMSQHELDWKIGMSDNSVAKWEVGIRKPRLSHLVYWAEALDSVVIISPMDGNEPTPANMALRANDNDHLPFLRDVA